LSLSAGKRVRPPPCEGRQPDFLEHRLDSGAPLGTRDLLEEEWVLDVLRRGQNRDQVERLEHKADLRLPQCGELSLRLLACRRPFNVDLA